jgi:hypothetical protein
MYFMGWRMFFKQRSAMLANGTKVKYGDLVEFTDSDGVKCRDTILRGLGREIGWLGIDYWGDIWQEL